MRNLAPTLSINHNWGNACNIDLMYGALLEDLLATRREIADCREMAGWHDQCQLLLRANCGLDLTDMARMLLAGARDAMRTLRALPAAAVSRCDGGPVMPLNPRLCALRRHPVASVCEDLASGQRLGHNWSAAEAARLACFELGRIHTTLGRLGPDWFGADAWGAAQLALAPHACGGAGPCCGVCGRRPTDPLPMEEPTAHGRCDPLAFWEPCRPAAAAPLAPLLPPSPEAATNGGEGRAPDGDQCFAWLPVLCWAMADIGLIVQHEACATSR